MKLNKKQTIALDYLEDNITEEVEYGGAAGGGKSVLGCYWQLKRRLKYPGTRGLIGRASLKTLKETTLNSFFEVCKIQGLKADIHFRYNQQSNQITFPNGSVIFLKDLFNYPSDPNFDELGSLEITDAFVDENNQVVEKAWNIVKSRIRYKLDENGLIPKILGSCNPSKGWIYSRFYKPFKEGSLDRKKRFIQALVTDNPDISSYYVENLKSLDEASKRRLLHGDWEYDDDPATLIEYEKILNCFTNNFESLKGEKYITADIARLGSDKIVIGVWDGWRVKVHWMEKERLNVTGEFIEKLRLKHDVPKSNVLCDDDGVGGGIVDFMKYKGFVNNSSPLSNPENGHPENYNHLKSQCYFRMAKRINESGIYIDCEDLTVKQKIIEELEQVKQYNMDKDSKMAVLPKDKVKEIIGRSPDFADMLMMREWFALKPKFITNW